DITVLLLGVLTDLERQPRPEALPMLRALSAVGPADVRSVAGTVADKTVAAGWPDVPWAAGLGTPSPGRCFGYDDTYNERRSLVITFSYGNSRHAVVTLVDDGLGGGIRDCQVCNYSERLRAEYRSLGQRPGLRYKDYDEAQARAILDDALAQPSCMPAHGRTGVGEDYLELLRARVALLPARPRPSRTRVTGAGNIHRLKVTLRGTKPPIWRRFEVPSDISLARLHTVIQIGFGWQNSHLHVFETPSGRYGTADPDLEIRGDKNKRLSAVADWPGDRIRYEYDFGDSWEHEIEVEAVQPAQPGVAYPRCTAGRQAGPPEDCGGVGGYYDLLDVLADPRHEQHEARLWWLGISSPSEFDAARFDRDAVNARLGRRATVLVRN
ncbi:MAG: plasmid pRiA4b ORF-3 family protein, partial [Actinobacteria bacterium]|nr:plasmid pRiA4b ORF-3 family protein [Actinomycetota bacterium]